MKIGTTVTRNGQEMMVTRAMGDEIGCIWRTERGISAGRYLAADVTVTGEWPADVAHAFRAEYERG